ncbi:MAG TPA: HEAT repeat domain-containing protein, partial [Anaeromyxobacter sp.]
RGRDELLSRVGTHPAAAVLVAVAILAGAVTLGAFEWQHGRAAADARALLRAGRPSDALAVLDAALDRRPGDRELVVLRGRALFRTPGRASDGIDAYATARATGALDEIAHEDLVGALARDRSVADRAARVLVDEGPASVAAVLKAAATASGVHRLRALAVARDLGAEDRVNRVEAYGALLSDPDCEIRRSAARRLGEIGDPAAIPALKKAAQAKVESKGFFGHVRSAPACGAPEAEAAAKRIEAARLP